PQRDRRGAEPLVRRVPAQLGEISQPCRARRAARSRIRSDGKRRDPFHGERRATRGRKRRAGRAVDGAGSCARMIRTGWAKRQERSNLPLWRVMTWISLRFGRPFGRFVLRLIAGYFVLFSPSARK